VLQSPTSTVPLHRHRQAAPLGSLDVEVERRLGFLPLGLLAASLGGVFSSGWIYPVRGEEVGTRVSALFFFLFWWSLVYVCQPDTPVWTV